MSARVAIFTSATSFLLGVLYTHWIADALTRWKPPSARSDEHFWTAAAYYRILSNGHPVAIAVVAAAAALGLLCALVGLASGSAANVMFDGASSLLYAIVIGIYVYHVIPTLLAHFLNFPSTAHASGKDFPSSLKPETLKLADAHLICSVVLTGVLVLQAARWWSLSDDQDGPEMGLASEADSMQRPETERRGDSGTDTEREKEKSG